MGGAMQLANKIAPWVAVGTAVIFLGMMIFNVAIAAGFASLASGGTTGNQAAPPTTTGGAIGACDTSRSLFKVGPGMGLGSANVKKEYVPLYESNASLAKLGDCGAAILAATHSIECPASFAGTGNCTVPHDDGVLGPMQFKQSTWDGEITDSETRKNCQASSSDILKVEKAICLTAFHDKHNGAPKDWRGAIFLYNHSDAYVDNVLHLAKEIAEKSK